jgi:hypothetical protein
MIPAVPQFATMRSVLSAWAVAGRLPSFLEDVSLAIGTKSDGEHELGREVAQLSKEVFQGWLSPQNLIESHTHVPLFTSLMSPLLALSWADTLATVSGGRDPIATEIRRSQQVQALTLRRCPMCVREDLAEYGLAHWRLFHQWPVARHCAVHGNLLQTTCAHCHAPIARLPVPQFPDDRCRVCGSKAWTAEPYTEAPAYWPTLTAMYEGLRTGRGRGTTPGSRVQEVTKPSAVLREGRKPVDDAERVFAAWRVGSLDELAALLGARRQPTQGVLPAGSARLCSSLLALACQHGTQFDAAGTTLAGQGQPCEGLAQGQEPPAQGRGAPRSCAIGAR